MLDQGSLRQRLGWWAHALLSMARRGLRFSPDPHDRANYDRLIKIAAEMRAEVDGARPAEVEVMICETVSLVGPIPVADAAVFNDQGQILLIQRADNQLWAMPGGGLDVGETPAEGACRETWEETGVTVRAKAMTGVYDSRFCGSQASWHLYHFVFLCEPIAGEPTISHETLAARWTDPDDLPPLSPGHARRIADAVTCYRTASGIPYFDR